MNYYVFETIISIQLAHERAQIGEIDHRIMEFVLKRFVLAQKAAFRKSYISRN
jgi:chorismate mutase